MGTIALQIPQLGQSDATEEAKIVSDLTALQTLLNGNLDRNNFAAGEVEPAFSTYKSMSVERVMDASNGSGGVGTAGTYVMNDIGADTGAVVPCSMTSRVFGFDPSLWAAGTRTTKMAVRAYCITNAVAPAVTFTVGLYPVATVGGASGVAPTVASLGSVAGSVAFASPAAASVNGSQSADFVAPAAGIYVLAVVFSGTPAGNSVTHIRAELLVRQV